ncbi:glycoside hydrolase family 88 protein [Paenibacillus cymbidii]|uniref:glycoside hydrolase family 88 protein n=1 Tax=Paenibacillus cymbidii TaxID=1639034 RepID=UPI0014366E31|nr:glycoside hydrolase family 88 protein [Paenibacillus cymbidii]
MDWTAKIYRNCLAYGDDLPFAAGKADGSYATNGKGHWTDGFWPGLILLAYADTRDPALLASYERYVPFLEERAANDAERNRANGCLPLDHDVGFIFHFTAVYHWMLTGSEASKRTGLQAAQVLLDRFHERGEFLRAWNDWEGDSPDFREEKKGKAIVDSLMNVPLLFWAHRVTGEARYRDAAERHVRRLRGLIVRDDGSTHHTFNFNPETGEPIGGKSVQGYADESCWSRGHAWAIYGFALAGRYTGDRQTLLAARKCAAYWLGSLLPDGDAPWDFAAPRNERLPIDTSAMAVACCGLLELAARLPDDAAALRQGAERLASRLTGAHAAPPFPRAGAFVLHGCSGPAYKKGSREEASGQYRNADQPLIFGDYYAYEALLRLQRGSLMLPMGFDGS